MGHTSTYLRVLDQVVQLPSVVMADLIQAMLKAYPGGLCLDDVRPIHRNGHVRLRKMCKDNDHFAAAVALPGGPGKGGYRIRSYPEAKALLKAGGSGG